MNIFSEIYGAYFRTASELLENEVTDAKTVRQTVSRDAFRDSVLFLPQKLIPGDEDWELFTRDEDGRLKRKTKKPPMKLLSKLQKMWLKAKLSDPRIRLFIDEDTLARLDSRLSDCEPLYKREQFRYTDRFSDGDSFSDPDYIKHFRAVLDAVKRKRLVYIDYVSGHGHSFSAMFALLKLEYSPKNAKFRAYCFKMEKGRPKRSGIINIGRITDIRDAGRCFNENISLDRYFSDRKCSSPAVIRVTNERNGVERFMMQFAAYEKHTVRNLETGEYTVELWYDESDETELLIQLLSFGPVIEIKEPKRLRELAKERVKKQHELLFASNKPT